MGIMGGGGNDGMVRDESWKGSVRAVQIQGTSPWYWYYYLQYHSVLEVPLVPKYARDYPGCYITSTYDTWKGGG